MRHVARERRRLSQHHLAEIVDIEPRVISRYERAVMLPRTDTLVMLGRVLETSVGKLLLGEEDDERAIAAAPTRDAALRERLPRAPAQRRRSTRHRPLIDALIAQHDCDHLVHRSRR